MLSDLALLSTLIGSNYPSLELIFMVPKVFEPSKFDCNRNSLLNCVPAGLCHFKMNSSKIRRSDFGRDTV